MERVRFSSERNVISLKDMGIRQLDILGRKNYKKAKKSVGRHRHVGCMEICYLDSGCKTFTIENQRYLLRGHDILINMPGVWHGTNDVISEKGREYWLSFQLSANEGRFLLADPRESSAIIKKLKNLPTTFRGHPSLKEHFENLFAAAIQKGPFYRTVLSKEALSLILKVIDLAENATSSSIHPRIRRVLEHIQRNMKEALDNKELASIAGLSLQRFHTIFKQETGIPPKEYVLREKLREARKLLSGSKYSVTDVAYELGFSSSQYFATVFKRFAGCSPGEFKYSQKKRS